MPNKELSELFTQHLQKALIASSNEEDSRFVEQMNRFIYSLVEVLSNLYEKGNLLNAVELLSIKKDIEESLIHLFGVEKESNDKLEKVTRAFSYSFLKTQFPDEVRLIIYDLIIKVASDINYLTGDSELFFDTYLNRMIKSEHKRLKKKFKDAPAIEDVLAFIEDAQKEEIRENQIWDFDTIVRIDKEFRGAWIERSSPELIQVLQKGWPQNSHRIKWLKDRNSLLWLFIKLNENKLDVPNGKLTDFISHCFIIDGIASDKRSISKAVSEVKKKYLAKGYAKPQSLVDIEDILKKVGFTVH